MEQPPQVKNIPILLESVNQQRIILICTRIIIIINVSAASTKPGEWRDETQGNTPSLTNLSAVDKHISESGLLILYPISMGIYFVCRLFCFSNPKLHFH